jgi:hypothetical protein
MALSLPGEGGLAILKPTKIFLIIGFSLALYPHRPAIQVTVLAGHKDITALILSYSKPIALPIRKAKNRPNISQVGFTIGSPPPK